VDLSAGDNIIIEGNVTLDGNGHSITGTGTGTGFGVAVFESGDLTIKNLVVQNFETGIRIDQGSTGVIVSNNEISNNNVGIGLLAGSSINTIKDNVISNNTKGVFIEGPQLFPPGGGKENEIFNNSFIDNLIQVEDLSNDFASTNRNNRFDDSTRGNYWSDFDSPAEGCNDGNNNGFCDLPYSVQPVIPGYIKQDNFPQIIPTYASLLTPSGLVSWWPGEPFLEDEFDRPDNNSLGQEWIEGESGSAKFSISSNTAFLNNPDEGTNIANGHAATKQIFDPSGLDIRVDITHSGGLSSRIGVGITPENDSDSDLAMFYIQAEADNNFDFRILINSAIVDTKLDAAPVNSLPHQLRLLINNDRTNVKAYFDSALQHDINITPLPPSPVHVKIGNAFADGPNTFSNARAHTVAYDNLLIQEAIDIFLGNDGVLENGTTTASGFVGQAFHLDGIDDYISVSDHVGLESGGTGEFTVDAWIKTSSLDPQIIVSHRGSGTEGYEIGLNTCGSGSGVWMCFWDGSGWGGVETNNFVMGEFNHVAAVSQAGLRFNVNGVTYEQLNTPNSFSSNDFIIGRSNVSPFNFFNGVIDELDFFDRALSATEIESIYFAGPAGKAKTVFIDFVGGGNPEGITKAIPSNTTPPAGFSLGTPAVFYDLTTTVAFIPPIEVCIDFTGVSFTGPQKLFHYEGTAWVDITTTVDTINKIICGDVDSLSPFAIFASDVEEVVIDIKPGSPNNKINPKSRGVIPVAILSTDSFDATTVDPRSVTFGPNKVGKAHRHRRGHRRDVNRDGKPDLLFHFRTRKTGITCGDTSAFLQGQTVNGQPIEGSDSIRVKCR